MTTTPIAGTGPLTHPQTQILIGQQLHPDSPLYNMAFAIILDQVIDRERFQRAWQIVADTSDALRTVVVSDTLDHAHRELISKAPATTIVHVEPTGISPEAFEDWCLSRCEIPLDLSNSLVDSVLIPLADGRSGWYLNQHHLVTDAWSTALLITQVSETYERLSLNRGAESAGANSHPHNSYYAVCASLSAKRKESDAAKDHWAIRAEQPSSETTLYGRRTAGRKTQSTRLTLNLTSAQTESLEALCTQTGFSSFVPEIARFNVFATLLAAWASHISTSENVVFEAPVSGRQTPAAKHTLGCFVELFTFCSLVAPEDSFRSLAARSLQESLRFLSNAQPGLSAPSSKTSSRMVLNYVPVRFNAFAGTSLTANWLHPGAADSVHALRLQVHDFNNTGCISLSFDLNDDTFPAQLQRRIPQHFVKLLDVMLANPDQPIATVDLLLRDERRIIEKLNLPATGRRAAETVVQKFKRIARQFPERIALNGKNQRISFAELSERMERVAEELHRRGAARGAILLITGKRSPELIIAILATLRVGAAYVPVDVSAPQARVQEIVQDSGASLLIAAPGAEISDQGLAAPVMRLTLDSFRTEKSHRPSVSGAASLTALEPSLDDVAYLIYTSGSTGKPKGVVIDHLGLADYLAWAEREYVRGETFHFAFFTSPAFDLTVTSIFLPLLTGGTLHIYPEPDAPVDTALMDVVAANAVDFLKLTPSHLSLLVRHGMDGFRVQRLVLGGENLTTRNAAAALSQLKGQVELTNEYGPTEAVVGCVTHRFDPEYDTSDDVPIGRPIDNVSIEVINHEGVQVPLGVPGELSVSRPGLARGYHGLAELTEARFVTGRQGMRSYRTGDRVRLREDGVLEYLGRMDRQLKLAGVRIEPAEIEQALGRVAGVREAAVITRRASNESQTRLEEVEHCVRCGLASNVPRVTLSEDRVCSVCRSFESTKGYAADYFRDEEELREVFANSRRDTPADYDCLMLYSGGKDSSYALSRLVDMGLRVYAFTLDNGYISEEAKDNIRLVTETLGVPVEFAQTSAMNAIFRDSLMRFSNVCNGCFKTIYTLSMKRAHDLGIPIIVTGLSRGQMFETRLTEDMFRGGSCSAAEVEDAVLAARKIYHRVPDEATRALDTELFEDDQIFEKVRFVDFYRYVDVSLDEVYRHLAERLGWSRPRDTGRSTNCLVNDVGIWVHKTERGFHNYALPYSWDVRMGHKTRAQALEELDDHIDLGRVDQMLTEIGYEPDSSGGTQPVLEAYYVSDEALAEDTLREQLSEILPKQLIPNSLFRVDFIPLAKSGKVDEVALATAVHGQLPARPYRAPNGPVEEYLVELWRRELGAERVGADDSFFELGGSSLIAMQVMLELCREFVIDLPLETLFKHPTLAALARIAEDQILADVEETV
ncbi:MAG: amino acid adenylation domain-containing protein [Pseudomonadota bacterium]